MIQNSTNDIHELLDEYPLKSERHQAAIKLWDLVNASVQLGYNWAKAEADVEMKPFARKGKKTTKAAADAGRKGATTRKKKQQDWQNSARSIAAQISQINPNLSVEDLATKTRDRLATTTGTKRSLSSVKNLLRETKRRGDLNTPKQDR